MKERPKAGKYATIYDVARDAGVSIATVSNVLNKPERVGDRTRSRVLAVVDALGYMPKADAATLARKRVGRLGVIAPFTTYPSFMRRLAGILAVASQQRLDVSIFDMESAATASSPVLASLPMRGSVDGLIVMGEPIEDLTEERLRQRGMPVVMVDADSSRFSMVSINDDAGGALGAEHLLALGHRRIGYMVEAQASEYESQARRRLRGFQAETSKVDGASLEICHAAGTMKAAREAGRVLLSKPGRPTAVMAHFDDLALGVMLAARDLGIDVPGQLSVLGFDDGPAAEAAGLSTIRQPLEESGSIAAKLLLDEIEAPAQRRVTLLDCEVVERESTSALRESAS